MAISQDLVEYLLFDNLRYFNTGGGPVTSSTVLSTALSTSTVAGMNAQSIFKAVSRRDIAINGGSATKKWPANWPTLTVKTLAPLLT